MVFPSAQKVENLQQPECTVVHYLNKRTGVGGALFWHCSLFTENCF